MEWIVYRATYECSGNTCVLVDAVPLYRIRLPLYDPVFSDMERCAQRFSL